MSGHTPAPWWTTDSGVRDRGGYIAHTNPVQRYEGQDERYVREVSQREADKCLIAAAPDLLEALILMVRTHDEPAETLLQEAKEQQWLAKARSAIARAQGIQS